MNAMSKVKWQSVISRHILVVAYLRTQGLFLSTEIQLKRCVLNGVILKFNIAVATT